MAKTRRSRRVSVDVGRKIRDRRRNQERQAATREQRASSASGTCGAVRINADRTRQYYVLPKATGNITKGEREHLGRA